MKAFIPIALLASSLVASEIIFYNPASSPITNKVTRRDPSLDETPYRNATNALVITNRTTQVGAGVTLSNLLTWCVVEGQQVRLMTQAEVDRIAATNAIISSNSTWQALYEARAEATNIVYGTNRSSGELVAAAMGKANWFFLNYVRTNDGKAALPVSTYTGKIFEYINELGQ